MKKNAIFWIREDFRIEHNPALSFASQNHDNVIALFIYNKTDFDKKREAQKWWLYKSLVEFKSELFKYKINLQILEGDEIDILSKIKKKDNISVYWNKIYEPDVIAKGKKIRDAFLKNEVEFKYFKGNILNEFQEVTKNDGTPFKVFSPFWRNAEEKYLSLPPSKNYVVKKQKDEEAAKLRDDEKRVERTLNDAQERWRRLEHMVPNRSRQTDPSSECGWQLDGTPLHH